MEFDKKSDIVVENLRAGLTDVWDIGYTKVSQTGSKIIFINGRGTGCRDGWFFLSGNLIAQRIGGVDRPIGFQWKEA